MANIIAQTKKQNAQNRRADSHYATVSDDDDEMYAAIEDPNNTYTSGSETYAQIQPPQEPLIISVEINSIPSNSPNNIQPILPLSSHPSANPSNSLTPRSSINEPTVDMQSRNIHNDHSRQESSSSCTSSVGNLVGSPKPEKRQANSPLPPTPKTTHQYQSNTSLTNPNTLQSRSIQNDGPRNVHNSGSAVPRNMHNDPGYETAEQSHEKAATIATTTNQRQISKENLRVNFGDKIHEDEPRKNRLSKDLEGMYAKVMKKTKLSNVPSETSPVPFRKSLTNDQQHLFLSDPDISHEINLPDALTRSIGASPGKNSTKSAQINVDNDYETIDKRRARSSAANYDSKNDPGYETIPADLPTNPSKSQTTSKVNRNLLSRASAPPGKHDSF